jgi:hypothetical protein
MYAEGDEVAEVLERRASEYRRIGKLLGTSEREREREGGRESERERDRERETPHRVSAHRQATRYVSLCRLNLLVYAAFSY